MARRRGWFLSWTVVGFVVSVMAPAWADDVLPKAGTWSTGLRAGYNFSIDNKDVEMVPVNLHIGYTFFKGHPWIFPEGSFEVAIEPFASVITKAENKKKTAHGSNEFGLGLPILTYHFNLGCGISPFVVGGLGVMYKDLRGLHLGGEFTFMETIGAGVSYFLNENVALSAEWRFRHMSNASIYKENAGLNSGIFLAGFSYYLPN
jgi:opacity protein-like surface antigen